MDREYIERETALEKVIEVKHHDPELSGVVLHRYIKEIDLKDIPAADVAPVVHGRKIEDEGIGVFYLCSLCGECLPYGANYCPNCGAKMDKEETNELDKR